MNKRGPLIAIGVAAAVITLVVVASTLSGGSGGSVADGPPIQQPASPFADSPVEPDDIQQLTPELASVSRDWITDFSKTTIDFDELVIGIRGRDRIRPIDDPQFETIAEIGDFVADQEPGLAFELDGDARFYPLSILTAHEIVNDVVGGRPVAVTYCPLCNSAIVFDSNVDGRVLRFGVSGLLRNSDLVMWDNATESLWQQLTGEGLVGDFAGAQLTFLPSSIKSYGDFKDRNPEGIVLGRDQGFGFTYGFNSYLGYTGGAGPYEPFAPDEIDPRYPALERVINVTIGDVAKAYPFSIASEERAINDTVNGTDVVIFAGGDTVDNLDTRVIREGKTIGTGIAFNRRVNGETLTFLPHDALTFEDVETGSIWNLNGIAVDGPMAGTSLEQVVHGNEFWFAWAAFNQGADVYTGQL
ncbi:MAG: DUF3179 domain-containing protein [Acidimicrobiia bacterium]